MNQRLVAALVAVPLVLGLLLYAAFARLPYGTFSPGGTVNVLGKTDDQPIIQVDGHQVYRDDGQLRMTTVGVSRAQPKGKQGMGLVRLLSVWADHDDAVYPYSFVHPDNETEKSSRQQGAAQMAQSQDVAVKVALDELGVTVPTVLKVASLTAGAPASKVLKVGDIFEKVNGVSVSSKPKVADDQELRDLIMAAPAGKPIRLTIERAGHTKVVSVTPEKEQGRQVIGVLPGYDYDFPFDVSIDISEDIGGPSAGLMFSLAVYDTLTPGSLTGGRSIAGTGEIEPDGSVGPIGGIQQKIAGARDAGAQLFIVPKDNCGDAQGGHPGSMRLMMGTTMHEVRLALQKYAQDPDATLPTCPKE